MPGATARFATRAASAAIWSHWSRRCASSRAKGTRWALQTALQECLQLANGISDTVDATGQKILRAIMAGERPFAFHGTQFAECGVAIQVGLQVPALTPAISIVPVVQPA
jgi:hypothetical protein